MNLSSSSCRPFSNNRESTSSLTNHQTQDSTASHSFQISGSSSLTMVHVIRMRPNLKVSCVLKPSPSCTHRAHQVTSKWVRQALNRNFLTGLTSQRTNRSSEIHIKAYKRHLKWVTNKTFLVQTVTTTLDSQLVPRTQYKGKNLNFTSLRAKTSRQCQTSGAGRIWCLTSQLMSFPLTGKLQEAKYGVTLFSQLITRLRSTTASNPMTKTSWKYVSSLPTPRSSSSYAKTTLKHSRASSSAASRTTRA